MKRRELKLIVNYVCDELFAECIAASMYNGNPDPNNVESLLVNIFFRQLGIKKGDKISICGKTQARWGISFFATISYEAVAVPILDNFHIDNISNMN